MDEEQKEIKIRKSRVRSIDNYPKTFKPNFALPAPSKPKEQLASPKAIHFKRTLNNDEWLKKHKIIHRLFGDGVPVEVIEEKKKNKMELHKIKAEKRKTSKEENKIKKNRTKEPNDKLFSEAHPKAYSTAKAILPRLQTFALAIGLLVAAMLEIMHRNFDFVLDWYRDSYIGPALVDLMTTKGRFEQWAAQYGAIFIVVLSVIICVTITFYVTFWRMWFKSYTKRSEGTDSYEGRCYWRTNNMWVKMWDNYYHSPPRSKVQYWIHTGWLPLFNPLNPPGCMIVIETEAKEKCESKGIYHLIVEEKPLRRLTGYKTYKTFDTGFYETGPIPIAYAEAEFEQRSRTLVDDTMQLSFGNAENRNKIMGDGLRLTNARLRRNILDGRKPKQQ